MGENQKKFQRRRRKVLQKEAMKNQRIFGK